MAAALESRRGSTVTIWIHGASGMGKARSSTASSSGRIVSRRPSCCKAGATSGSRCPTRRSTVSSTTSRAASWRLVEGESSACSPATPTCSPASFLRSGARWALLRRLLTRRWIRACSRRRACLLAELLRRVAKGRRSSSRSTTFQWGTADSAMVIAEVLRGEGAPPALLLFSFRTSDRETKPAAPAPAPRRPRAARRDDADARGRAPRPRRRVRARPRSLSRSGLLRAGGSRRRSRARRPGSRSCSARLSGNSRRRAPGTRRRRCSSSASSRPVRDAPARRAQCRRRRPCFPPGPRRPGADRHVRAAAIHDTARNPAVIRSAHLVLTRGENWHTPARAVSRPDPGDRGGVPAVQRAARPSREAGRGAARGSGSRPGARGAPLPERGRPRAGCAPRGGCRGASLLALARTITRRQPLRARRPDGCGGEIHPASTPSSPRRCPAPAEARRPPRASPAPPATPRPIGPQQPDGARPRAPRRRAVLAQRPRRSGPRHAAPRARLRGHPLPGDDGEAVASVLVHRAQIGLARRARKGGRRVEVTRFDRARLGTYWSAGLGLSMVDTIRSADFQIRHQLLAIRSGDPVHVARSLSSQVAFLASEGGPRITRALRRDHRAGRPYRGRGRRSGALGPRHAVRGRGRLFPERLPGGALALPRVERICRSLRRAVAWRSTNTQIYGLWSLGYLGDLAALGREIPRALKEARERGDAFAATSLRLGLPNIIWLSADRPDDARAEVEEAMRGWTRRGFHSQHYFEAGGRDPDRPVSQRRSGSPRARRADLDAGGRRVPPAPPEPPYGTHPHLRARALIAVAADTELVASRRRRLLASARRDARRIEVEPSAWSDPLAASLRAGSPLWKRTWAPPTAGWIGQRMGSIASKMALTLLRRRAFGTASPAHGGQEARSATSARCMAALGVAVPRRMAALLLPGCGQVDA